MFFLGGQRILSIGIFLLCFCFHALAAASDLPVKEGMRGDNVRRVQILLIACGYLRGEADGVCGSDTVKAIEHFQKDAGLDADGICGQKTFDLLQDRGKEREMAEAEEVPVGGIVKLGRRGPGVAHVQELLIAKGYLSGEADGTCGSKTAGAIAHFQKDMGLTADGVCGSLTYAALTGEVREKRPAHHEHYAKNKGQVVYVSATAYSAYDPGNSRRTASGTPVRRGVIAVDPSFIALGTRVYIPGYGEAVAEDVGWGVRGNHIDVAFDSHEEAMAFGRQDLEIYIIE